ncbi:molybdopterin dinucleotide binding domain-containing protein [Paenibacillus phoenicis]
MLQSAFAEDSFGRNITQTTYRDPLGHDPSSGSGIRRGKARNGSYRAGVGAAGERRGAYAAVHVVVDLFETETSAYADWLLPGTSFLEVEETMTNLEGRVFCRPRVCCAPSPNGWARLTTRRGSLEVAAKVTADIHPRTMFVPFHWGGDLAVNRLTNDALHPVSRMPEFKISAVRAESVEAGDTGSGADTSADGASWGSARDDGEAKYTAVQHTAERTADPAALVASRHERS